MYYIIEGWMVIQDLCLWRIDMHKVLWTTGLIFMIIGTCGVCGFWNVKFPRNNAKNLKWFVVIILGMLINLFYIINDFLQK